MQIRIKTAEEFRDAHVTIEIVAERDGYQLADQISERYEAEMRRANNAEERVVELERDARVTAVTTDSLRRQLADETKRADKWGLMVAKNSAPEGIYARAQNLASQLDAKEQAVRELREVARHLHEGLDRAADNFKIIQDENRDLRTRLKVAQSERVTSREQAERAERAEKRVSLLDSKRNEALSKLEEIRGVARSDRANSAIVQQIRDILEQA